MSVVAIGATETVDPLRLLGFEIVKVSGKPSPDEIEAIVSKILENRVALVEGEIYSYVKDRLSQVMAVMKEPPLVVVIPSSEEVSTNRLEELYNKLSLAVGVRLKWVKKE
ncbi:hypothetical protein IG193_03485 [Infirmifilum lucidum]|uniref:V-type ATP synthase subunit F n=1 Tax=Infirmifilum lucidum TaxID=2776706 RepID=A0A7L9FKI4_9CREN|nr:V-type ATP synthase subunit F [Infirmifilum lucidum]QOJ79533.1 hypothetical protein IG193_03485 [Infirmifilum lucidum]